MKLIALYYPTRLALAIAWSDALAALPGQVSQDPATLRTYLSRPGKWQASLASGVVTFQPDAGGDPVQCRAEWVRTPESILALNKELRKIDDYDQQEFEDETRRAIDMAGGCSRCGDLDGYTCICDDDDDLF